MPPQHSSYLWSLQQHPGCGLGALAGGRKPQAGWILLPGSQSTRSAPGRWDEGSLSPACSFQGRDTCSTQVCSEPSSWGPSEVGRQQGWPLPGHCHGLLWDPLFPLLGAGRGDKVGVTPGNGRKGPGAHWGVWGSWAIGRAPLIWWDRPLRSCAPPNPVGDRHTHPSAWLCRELPRGAQPLCCARPAQNSQNKEYPYVAYLIK